MSQFFPLDKAQITLSLKPHTHNLSGNITQGSYWESAWLSEWRKIIRLNIPKHFSRTFLHFLKKELLITLTKVWIAPKAINGKISKWVNINILSQWTFHYACENKQKPGYPDFMAEWIMLEMGKNWGFIRRTYLFHCLQFFIYSICFCCFIKGRNFFLNLFLSSAELL